MSDRAIAKHVGVSAPFVATVRNECGPSVNGLQIDIRSVTRNGKTYEQNTAKIGGSKLPSTTKAKPKKNAAAGPDELPPAEPVGATIADDVTDEIVDRC